MRATGATRAAASAVDGLVALGIAWSAVDAAALGNTWTFLAELALAVAFATLAWGIAFAEPWALPAQAVAVAVVALGVLPWHPFWSGPAAWPLDALPFAGCLPLMPWRRSAHASHELGPEAQVIHGPMRSVASSPTIPGASPTLPAR